MFRASFYEVILAAALLSGASPLALGQQFMSTEVFGGSGGNRFSDSLPSTGARIVEVHIRYAEVVDSVQIVYALSDGRTVTGSRHGGSGGRESVFRLDADEYIVGLSGRYGDGIDSLRIHTNKRVSDPFGGRGGNRDYRIDLPAGNQAIGFAGQAGDYLDAIGLTYAAIRSQRRFGIFSGAPPTQPQGSQRPGSGVSGAYPGAPAPPSSPQRSGSGGVGYNSGAPASARQIAETTTAGGGGGSNFSDRDIPQGARISEVRVRASERVDAIQAIYLLPDGRTIEGPRHGGWGGRESVLRLDSDEYIVGLSGRYGDGIDSLRIHTNKRITQPFGGRGGNRDYRIEVPIQNQAVGFAGRAGESLDAIGLAYSALTPGAQRSPRRP